MARPEPGAGIGRRCYGVAVWKSTTPTNGRRTLVLVTGDGGSAPSPVYARVDALKAELEREDWLFVDVDLRHEAPAALHHSDDRAEKGQTARGAMGAGYRKWTRTIRRLGPPVGAGWSRITWPSGGCTGERCGRTLRAPRRWSPGRGPGTDSAADRICA